MLKILGIFLKVNHLNNFFKCIANNNKDLIFKNFSRFSIEFKTMMNERK